MNKLHTIPEAIEALQKGEMLVVIDRPDRENQGDIILPAETMTTEKANFLIKECRGLFCIPITQARALELDFPLMVSPLENTEKFKCKFTVSVDARDVTSHGISAADRARTVQAITNPQAKPTDFVRPGHAFPLIASDGGVLERDGHTEAAVDLMRLAGFQPMGVLSEILGDDGEPANNHELQQFAKKHSLKMISISDLVSYLKQHPLPPITSPSLYKTAEAKLPTEYGNFFVNVYKSIRDNREHIALIMGKPKGNDVLTRVHSQCITGDTLHSKKCDCQEQLHTSLKIISQAKEGILLYLNQEGRGIGLTNKIKAYALQEQGLDTVQANEALQLPVDARDFSIAAEILKLLQITDVSLLTNNPAKVKQLTSYGITVTQQIPLQTKPNKHNKKYLKTKKEKLGHNL